MCEACDAATQQAGISPALASRARRIEAALPGQKVPDTAWEILLGRSGGAVPWTQTKRMLACLDQAAQQAGARLRCDAA